MQNTPHVLIIDDDDRIRELLSEYLSGRGHDVRTAVNGREGLEAIRAQRPDIVVLDLNMPVLGGLDVLRRMRPDDTTPVIILTARGDDHDRIVGLELGADDYLPKPFNPRELVARIDAVLRRARPSSPAPMLTAGPLKLDSDRREVRLNGTPVELTSTEFDLLHALMANAGRVVARDRLMQLGRGEEFAAFDRSVDVHISHIRRKLDDDPRSPRLIKTVRGVGYLVPSNPAS